MNGIPKLSALTRALLPSPRRVFARAHRTHLQLCAARRLRRRDTKGAASPKPLYGPPPALTRRMKVPVLAAALPFVFAILWASSYVAAKVGLADISPYAFVAIRLAMAAVAAALMVVVLRAPRGPLRQRWC